MGDRATAHQQLEERAEGRAGASGGIQQATEVPTSTVGCYYVINLFSSVLTAD